jgi:hypothetical protein
MEINSEMLELSSHDAEHWYVFIELLKILTQRVFSWSIYWGDNQALEIFVDVWR